MPHEKCRWMGEFAIKIFYREQIYSLNLLDNNANDTDNQIYEISQ